MDGRRLLLSAAILPPPDANGMLLQGAERPARGECVITNEERIRRSFSMRGSAIVDPSGSDSEKPRDSIKTAVSAAMSALRVGSLSGAHEGGNCFKIAISASRFTEGAAIVLRTIT